jgi:hypothetical protein
MDFLYILIAAWALYTVYKNIASGLYMYIIYLAVAYFIVRFMVTGPKWRLFLAVILANLLSIGFIIGNMFSVIRKINIPVPASEGTI